MEASALAFSRDGRLLACGIGTDDISVLDARSGRQIAFLESQRSTFASGLPLILCLAFSPDSQYLASGSDDGSVSIWDATEWKHVKRFVVEAAGINQIAFSYDGKRIVITSWNDCTVVLDWNAPDFDPTKFVDRTPGEEFEVFYGCDAVAVAAGLSRFPIVARSGNSDSHFRAPLPHQTLAWFPEKIDLLATHPNGRSWLGVTGHTHMQFLTIEGGFVEELLAHRELEDEVVFVGG